MGDRRKGAGDRIEREPKINKPYLEKIKKKEVTIITKYCKDAALRFGYDFH